jgi:hypothetical protein
MLLNEFLKEYRKVETTAQRFRGGPRATAQAN